MKQQTDQHRSERSFDVGDWVFLQLQPYKQMSLKQAKKDNKLSPTYYGPYKVLQKIGTMAYKLELPAVSRVHPVFHVSCLKKVIGDKLPIQTILLELDEEGKIIGTGSSHRNKNSTAMKSINFGVSYQVEELIR